MTNSGKADYYSLRKQLDDNKNGILNPPKTSEERSSKYSKMRNILEDNDPTKGEIPSQKAIIILRYTRRKEIKKEKNPFSDYKTRKKYWIPEAERKIKIYSKEDIEEVIICKLNRLETEGINSKRRLVGEGDGNYNVKRDLDYHCSGSNNDKQINLWAYETSLNGIKDIKEILSNKRLLRKKGISRKERKEYEKTFKKRVDRVLIQGVKYATTPENIQLMENMLNYCRKNNLIPKKIREKKNLEKTLITSP